VTSAERCRRDRSDVFEVQTESRCVALDERVMCIELIADCDVAHECSADDSATWPTEAIRVNAMRVNLFGCHVERC